MPNKALEEQLVDRRIQVTGEARSLAIEQLRPTLAGLTRHHRRVLEAALHDADYRADAEQVIDLASHFLGQAASQSQQELETEIAWASRKAVDYLQLRPGCGFTCSARVFHSATPSPHGTLTLQLCPDALPALLVDLLPRAVEDEVWGAVGLRYRQYRRCVELYLADQPQARVFLSGVKAKTWKAAVAFAQSVFDEPPRWTWNRSEALTWEERKDLGQWTRTHGPVALTSGILRRHNAFGGALWSKWWASGNHLSIEWPDGPPRDETAYLLVNNLFGMPECTVDRTDAHATYSIVDQPGPGDVNAALRSTTMPEQPEGDAMLTRLSSHSKVSHAWLAYWASTSEDQA
ncbi:hypothetical protein [Catelliglobosispora koreensis]|uniref:hypothetical protein n=1 Tax=Catelliglobosispora koreensis TaxID=129052 RepID=UPI00037EA631|nr:hypothetical protein [Catelliglobosispora koreensis]